MEITSNYESMMRTTKLILSLAVSAVLTSTSPLMADRAQELFVQNCAVCHGVDGHPTPVGLALKTRNFTTEPFKQGSELANIAKTLETGVPGTGMVSFSYLHFEDRKLLAQRVMELHAPYVKKAEAAKSPIAIPQQAVAGAQQALSGVAQGLQQALSGQSSPSSAPAGPVQSSGNATTSNVAPAVDPLIERGRTLFKKGTCNTCHGENGQADTATGIALKARNFVEGNYKLGGTIESIVGVLKNGIPGTAMVAFPAIANNPDDAKALATFLLALKGHPEIANSPAPEVPVGSGNISLAYAMHLLAVPVRYPLQIQMMDDSAGSKVFSENCTSCHGANGQGGVATRFISAAPYFRVKTEPLLGFDGRWMKEDTFTNIVTEGIAGKLMPGHGTLTRQQLQDLYQFFVACREKAK